ncbi:hypothetical protein [Nocardia nepalensis]|uniref:hypothetical protein n=1 Tax=Nocardia nepalensis TaxID=3375448 RepID=UPI003B678417
MLRNLFRIGEKSRVAAVGYSLNVFDDLLGLHRLLYRRYGPVHWTSAFGTRLVLAVGQEAVGEVWPTGTRHSRMRVGVASSARSSIAGSS